MTSTKQIRSIMRNAGLNGFGIWTNKYNACRTVKCYAGVNPGPLMRALYEQTKGTDITVKKLRTGRLASVIVRIPN